MARSPEGARGLTAAGLAGLLARLDPDPERAATAYEVLRRTLVKFFDWRGAWVPEEGADETLDRLARKLAAGDQVGDVRSFAHGIARRVLLEQARRPEARIARADETELDGLAALDASAEADDEPVPACLERCLAELPRESRELILQYYVAEGRAKIENRRRVAEDLGLSDNALRSRAQRVRDRLERCIAQCLAKK